MNIFYEDFPMALVINNEEYPIITDFREWIKFSDMIKSDIPSQMKYTFMSEMFLDSVPTLDEMTIPLVFETIKNFLLMSEIQIPEKQSSNSGLTTTDKAVLSYEYDAPYIIAAFLKEYRIDLTDIDYMHWWKFKILLDGLSEESQIKQRIYYRGLDLNSIDKADRKRISKIQKQIALPEYEYVSDGEIGNAF